MFEAEKVGAAAATQAKWGMVMFMALASARGKGSLITRMEAAGFI